MQLDFTLSYLENKWVCYDNSIKITGESLDEVDDYLEDYFKEKYKKGTIEVTMFFDFERFPSWHRQYMSHYFNRSMIFNLNK